MARIRPGEATRTIGSMAIKKELVRKVLLLVMRYQFGSEEDKAGLEEELYLLLIDLILDMIPGDEV